MQRGLPIVLFFLVLTFSAKPQGKSHAQVDSLINALPPLNDSARIDCLNTISNAYLVANEMNAAEYYAKIAAIESRQVNYTHGLAEAKSLLAELTEDDFPKAEKLAREAIQLYAASTNKKRLAETYYNLGFVLYAQSKFTEALRNLDSSFMLFNQYNNAEGMCWALIVTEWVYEESGNYGKAFELARKGLTIAIKSNNEWFRRIQLTTIGFLFRDIEDYRTALPYSLAALQNLKPKEYSNVDIVQLLGVAELYSLLHKNDSAQYYYNFVDTTNERALRFYLASSGEHLLQQKKYEAALPRFTQALQFHKASNDRNQVMRTLVDLAKTYFALNNSTAALTAAWEAVHIARQTGAKQIMRNGYQILYSIYDNLKKPDSAYYYYKEFTRINDSISTDQVKGKLIAYNYEQRIELMNKEKLISQQQFKIQQQQLKQGALQREFLIGSIATLLLLAGFGFRNITLKRRNEAHRRKLAENELQIQKFESEKIKTELQKQAAELKIQALRAQMNPHFIFNSLNSINCYILKNDKEEASAHLTRFSKLIRTVLDFSQKNLVSLQEELYCLKLYIQLEQLRFTEPFTCNITCDENIDLEETFIAPLLLQPFVENAIWHGLMHKEGKGYLQIELFKEDRALCCKITDDGIGRSSAVALKNDASSNHKSTGMRITTDRITILQKELWPDNGVKITDLVLPNGEPAGTEVLFKIPMHHD